MRAYARPIVAVAQSSLPRNTSPQVAPADLSAVSQSINAFGLDLYRALAESDQAAASGNLFFSPYSISTALAMVYGGARSETERQMAETLRYALPQDALPQERLHPAFNALDLALLAPGQPFTLTVANAAWGQEGYKFRPVYLDLLATNYGVGVQQADFVSEASREAARAAINGWANERTNGKIRELIAPHLLNDMTRLVLTNAIYFKGEWASPFRAEKTQRQSFTRLDGSQVTAQMMRQRGAWVVGEGDDYQAVELPYKGERIRMVAILPAAGRLAEFERSLDAARLAEILGSLKREEDVELSIPKFTFEAGYELEKVLPDMGMPDVFDPDRADLSGMYEPDQQPLFLKYVVHKAFVAVDEKGTEAAAATAAITEAVSMPLTVVFDRPFLFLIRDTDTGALLFLGRLADPTE